MEALEHNWLKARKHERGLTLKKHRINELQVNPDRSLEEDIKIANYQDELVVAERQYTRTLALVRDAEMELAAALQEKERILAKNPEFLDLSYSELQQRYSHLVFCSSLAKTIAVKRISHELNIPEEVISILADLDSETAGFVLRQSGEVAKTICGQLPLSVEPVFDLSQLTKEQITELQKAIKSAEVHVS
jgi:hypothetical protein